MARSVSRSAARNTESPPQDVEIIDADDTEAESEDEYEVEAIVAHKPLRGGKHQYLVSWKGYGPEHNTWEPQANVEHAEDIVKNYWAKQPKDQIGDVRKSKAATPDSTQRKTKRARTSAAARAATPPEDDLQYADTHTDPIGKYEKVRDWEPLVKSIDTVERTSDNKLLVYMTMVDGDQLAQSTVVTNKRCPQAMLAFYESHLKWRNQN